MTINMLVDKLADGLIIELVDSKSGNIWMEYTIEEVKADNLIKCLLIKEIGVNNNHLRIVV